MKTLSFLLGCTLAFATLATSAFAQESKIGYVNTQRITTESTIAKSAQAKLEQEFSKRGKELADLQTALKSFGENGFLDCGDS